MMKQMSDSPTPPEARRREFGAFLRTRRERLTPASVGLAEGFRRRTPGLRREGVALVAGGRTTRYTRLEQRRDAPASMGEPSAPSEALYLHPAQRPPLCPPTPPPPP